MPSTISWASSEPRTALRPPPRPAGKPQGYPGTIRVNAPTSRRPPALRWRARSSAHRPLRPAIRLSLTVDVIVNPSLLVSCRPPWPLPRSLGSSHQNPSVSMHKDNCIGPLPGGPLGQKPAWVLGIAHSELPQIRSTSVTVQLSVELAYVVAIVGHDHKWLSPLHPHCTSPSLQRDEGAVAILTLRSLIPSSWWGKHRRRWPPLSSPCASSASVYGGTTRRANLPSRLPNTVMTFGESWLASSITLPPWCFMLGGVGDQSLW